MFCRTARSQNVTLKWPQQPASQPKPQAKPNSQQSSALIDRRPLAGSIVGHTYTNKFFDFSIAFPEEWVVVFVNQGPQSDKKGVVYFLLLVGGLDKRTNGTRWITIAAARPPGSSMSKKTAENAVEGVANSLNLMASMGLDKGFRLIGKRTEMLLGGTRMSRLQFDAEVESQGSSYDTRVSQFALVEHGYMLFFLSSDPVNHESDPESATKALDSLHFGKSHTSPQ